jgi:hypothetical protein
MNRACIGATRSAALAGRERRGAPGRLPAFHEDGADRYDEDAATGCQDNKIVDHAFVPMRGSGRQADAAAPGPAIILPDFLSECGHLSDYFNRVAPSLRSRVRRGPYNFKLRHHANIVTLRVHSVWMAFLSLRASGGGKALDSPIAAAQSASERPQDRFICLITALR